MSMTHPYQFTGMCWTELFSTRDERGLVDGNGRINLSLSTNSVYSYIFQAEPLQDQFPSFTLTTRSPSTFIVHTQLSSAVVSNGYHFLREAYNSIPVLCPHRTVPQVPTRPPIHPHRFDSATQLLFPTFIPQPTSCPLQLFKSASLILSPYIQYRAIIITHSLTTFRAEVFLQWATCFFPPK